MPATMASTVRGEGVHPFKRKASNKNVLKGVSLNKANQPNQVQLDNLNSQRKTPQLDVSGQEMAAATYHHIEVRAQINQLQQDSQISPQRSRNTVTVELAKNNIQRTPHKTQIQLLQPTVNQSLQQEDERLTPIFNRTFQNNHHQRQFIQPIDQTQRHPAFMKLSELADITNPQDQESGSRSLTSKNNIRNRRQIKQTGPILQTNQALTSPTKAHSFNIQAFQANQYQQSDNNHIFQVTKPNSFLQQTFQVSNVGKWIEIPAEVGNKLMSQPMTPNKTRQQQSLGSPSNHISSHRKLSARPIYHDQEDDRIMQVLNIVDKTEYQSLIGQLTEKQTNFLDRHGYANQKDQQPHPFTITSIGQMSSPQKPQSIHQTQMIEPGHQWNSARLGSSPLQQQSQSTVYNFNNAIMASQAQPKNGQATKSLSNQAPDLNSNQNRRQRAARKVAAAGEAIMDKQQLNLYRSFF